MYDKDKIEDSLEFVKKIYLYEKCSPDKVTDMMDIQNVSRKDFIDADTYINNIHSDEAEKYVHENEDETEEKDNSEGKFCFMDFVYILVCVAVSVAIAFCVTRYVVHHTKVVGSSMDNTLNDGDYLLVEKVSYYFDEPERFDIIVFPYSKDVYYIKRVIGLPGEKVQIIDGKVYINDELLEEDIYGNDVIHDAGIANEPLYIKEDEIFVLGDNRNSSIDSRRKSVGNIKLEKIEGHAFFRIWPFAEFGGVD